MNETVASLFTALLYILMVAIVVRSLLTWFPVDPRNQFSRILYTVTEPILDPLRRIVPRLGMIDLSGMAAIVLLYVMIQVVARAADA